jgi:hypothetical protein
MDAKMNAKMNAKTDAKTDARNSAFRTFGIGSLFGIPLLFGIPTFGILLFDIQTSHHLDLSNIYVIG